MAFKNITENTWSATGDYGTEFKDELIAMRDRIGDMIEDLKDYKRDIANESDNTKLTEDAIDAVEAMVKKLEYSKSNIQLSITSIKYYNEG